MAELALIDRLATQVFWAGFSVLIFIIAFTALLVFGPVVSAAMA